MAEAQQANQLSRGVLFSPYKRSSALFRRSMKKLLPGYLLSSISTTVLLTVDSVVVSNVVGSEALGAIGYVSVFVSILNALICFLVTGIISFLSELIGKGNEKELNEGFICVYTCSLMFIALLSLLQLPIYQVCISFYDISPAVRAYARAYAVGIMLMMPFSFCATMLSKIFITYGKSKLLLALSFVECGLNLLLDYLFVVVLGMGIAGAGFGSLIACAVRAILSALFVSRIRKWPGFSWEVCRKKARKLLTLSFPYGLSMFINALQGYVFAYVLTSFFAEDGVAVQGVITFAITIVSMFSGAISNVTQPMLGVKKGMGDYVGEYIVMREACISVLLICGAVSAIFFCMPWIAFDIYGYSNVPAFGYSAMRICLINALLGGVFTVLFGFLLLNGKHRELNRQRYICEIGLWGLVAALIFILKKSGMIFAIDLIITLIELVWMGLMFSKIYKGDKDKIENTMCFFFSVEKDKAVDLSESLAQYLNSLPVNSSLANKLGICVEEAAGYMENCSQRHDATMEITISINGDSAVFSSLDDAVAAETADMEAIKPAGFSNMHMLRAISDDLQLQTTMRLNCMTIRLSGAQQSLS